MNTNDSKRIDDIRQDIRDLRTYLDANFSLMEKKMDDRVSQTKKTTAQNILEIRRNVQKNKKEIDLINERFEMRFNKLDKKLFKLFLVGNGVGMILGSIFTLIFQWIIASL